jgi:serine phosphatase RsbU (regulator of sigma subunit)
MILSIQDVLRKVPLFAPLSSHELGALISSFTRIEVKTGEILFYEGEPGDTFFVVEQGKIEIIKSIGAPGERKVAERGVSEFFGEMSLFNMEHQRTASVRATVDTVLLTLNKSDFNKLLHRHPQLAYEMVRVLSKRLNESHNHSINDLLKLNQELVQANAELVAAQIQLVEKERLERELQVGQEIQKSILPQSLPLIPGVNLGALMKPARMVGGDFYDVVRLNKNKAALVIGDVTDKGIPAAIFMAQTFALIHAAINPRISPRTTLLKVNQSMLEMNADGLFATVLFGILDLNTHEFNYARAGHEPPVIVLPGENARDVQYQTGQPLGILDNPVIDEQQVFLPSGSMMLLYTDGLTDNGITNSKLTDDNQDQGKVQSDQKNHWMDLFYSLRESPAQEICNTIYQTMCKPPQFDDVTMVIAKIS